MVKGDLKMTKAQERYQRVRAERLSPHAERRVFRQQRAEALLASGVTRANIARRLGCSESTVTDMLRGL